LCFCCHFRIHRIAITADAYAAEIKVFSSNALKSVLEQLGPQFEKTIQNKLSFTLAPAVLLKAQIDQGATFDVAILTAPLTDAFVAAGKIDMRSPARTLAPPRRSSNSLRRPRPYRYSRPRGWSRVDRG